jgi:cation transport regulator ChaB
MIVLPRQARDKYRKNSKSAVFLQATRIKGVSKHSEEHEVLIVPWSAVKVREKKRDDTTGVTTIFADVLEDATIAPGDLPTIVA